jgi:hypothetical protein
VESRTLKRGVVAAGLLLAAAAAAWRYLPPMMQPTAAGRPPRVYAPEGVRIKVEVVNATRTRGLARRATLFLRDAGFDVVRFTTDTARRDTTLVLDRSGHPDWAARVAKALGGARVESRPDSSRYLDVTVLLGTTWRPPSEPFYP